jgi:hypothetical protein
MIIFGAVEFRKQDTYTKTFQNKVFIKGKFPLKILNSVNPEL